MTLRQELNKDFRKHSEAEAYKAEMSKQGLHSYYEEIWDYDGPMYCVMVWER